MIKYDHYDDAIIGPALIWRDQQRVGVLVYDAEKIRDILMRDGMDAEEAKETAKASANAKLKALGLTDSEIAAITA